MRLREERDVLQIRRKRINHRVAATHERILQQAVVPVSIDKPDGPKTAPKTIEIGHIRIEIDQCTYRNQRSRSCGGLSGKALNRLIGIELLRCVDSY